MASLVQERWILAAFVHILLSLAAWNILDSSAQDGSLKYIGKMSFLRMVPVGSSVDLSCELNDSSVAVTLWQMLGSGGMYTPRKNLVNYGQLFTLHRVSSSMRGTYLCKARKGQFSHNIGMIWLKPSPKDPPKPTVDARQKVLLVSRDANLTCKATGTRISNVQWYKRARPLSMQQQAISKELNLNGETWITILVLKDVQVNQAGWYECRVFETNEAFGFWSTHVKLNVIGTGKKIDALAKKKDCSVVQKWKKSIVNHMFWCASSTDDDDPDLKEAKWLSITNHLMNRHSGHENPLFPKCAHGRLHGRERKKKWLKPDKTECPELDGTFADPQRTTGYLVCLGGISTRMNCSKGLVWRDDKKACDTPAPVVKWESTHHSLRLLKKTVGDSVILNCRMSDPNVRVKLKQKGAFGAMRERFTDGCRVSRLGQTFVIHAVNFKDLGIYYCEAPHLKIRRKEEAYLKVQPAPSSAIYQGYRNLLVSFGSSLDLNCGAPNIFQPLIFLEIIRMDGITQLTPDGHRVTLTGRTVTIHGLDHSMRGRVVCKVISSCNQAQKDVDLGHLLPVPPKGTPPIPEVSQRLSLVNKGESLNITCSVSGGERHTISWFKNKEPVSEDFVISSAFRSVLMFGNITKFDAGDYECRTMDFGDGYWLKTATVMVTDSSAAFHTYVPPTTPPFSTTKQTAPSVTEIVPYQPVDIVCRMFQADFEINLWQESTPGTYIQRTADGVAIIRQGNTFTITQGRQNDEGTYYCQAVNSNKLLAAVLTFSGIQLPEKVAWVPNKSKNVDHMNGADLACIVYSSVPADRSVWLKTDKAGNNINITSDKHITRSNTSGPVKELVLQIRNATEQDAGMYTCRAQFGAVVKEDTLQLTVTGPKKGEVLLHSGSQTVNESESAEFWCKAGGSPQPKIIWKKHGQDLGECNLRWGAVNCRTFSERHKVSFNKGTSFLRVVNTVFHKDKGPYSCTVENTAGGENVTLHLTVQVKPSIKKYRVSENPMIISANKSVHLNCSIRHRSPPPTLTWWYNNCPEDATACKPSLDAEWKRLKTDNMSSLEQLLVPPSRDHVLYKCIAENWLGQDSITYTILRRLDDKPPKIINFTTKASVNASQNVELFCETEGKPPFADVQWLKNGVSVGSCKGELQQNKTCVLDQQQRKYSISWRGSGAELTIKNVFHPFDTGEFTCVAVNAVGMDNKTVRLDIYEKPVLNKKNETDFRVLSFRDATMIQSTALRGHPIPHFKWFQQRIEMCASGCKPDAKRWGRVPRHVIDPSEQVPSRISSLYLPPGRKGYFFRCIAENSLGHDDVVFSVHRIDIETVLPKIIPSSPIQRVDEGSRLTILCQASTGDFLHLAWQRRSRPQDLPAILTRNKHNITSALTIDHAQMEDADDYLCYGYGWTANETKISVITVRVSEFVVPVVSLSNQTIQEETTTSATLTCFISSGYPAPNITWYKNDTRLSLLALRSPDDCRINGFYYMEKHRPPFAKDLVICKPSHVENTGVYKCEAKNSKGIASSEAFLNVLAQPKIFNMVDHKLLKELGEKVNVSCKARGNPSPSVNWVKKTAADGRHVPAKQRDWENHTLRINSLLEEHYGDYMCLAENKLGNDTVVLSLVKPAPTGAAKGPPTSKASLIVAIVVSIALFLVLLLIAAILYRRRNLYGGFYICTTPPLPDMIPRLDSSIPLIEQVNKLPYDKRWEFPREQLHFGKVLGSGAFGEVYLAEAEGSIISDNISAKTSRHRLSTVRDSRRGSTVSQGPIKVAVKTLKDRAEDSERKDLISELKILIHIGSHKNIVNLLAACTKGRYSDICVIIEYCPHGNMLHFLRNKREMYNPVWLPPTDDPDKQFSMTDVVSAAFQVARAMEFLASRKCVHRDLAARNVLVGEKYVVKVADFGLARDVYKDDTYIKVSPGLVPVKWMAIESLTDRVYSEQSDVWSFGVFLWELFTLGGNPYPNLPPTEIYQYIIEGSRMERPVDCPEEMYAMMRDCWMERTVDRPNFTALVQRLDHVIESNIAAMGREGYLELGNDPVMPREEIDDDGYLRPREIVPPGYKAALLNGNATSGSNGLLLPESYKEDLQGSNRSLTNESKSKDLIQERYTELGFKPANNANDLAETAL